MNAAMYQARRDAGLCVWSSGCRRSPTPGAQLCRTHRRKSNALQSAAHKKQYMAKKLAGHCVVFGCSERAGEETVSCARHAEGERARARQPKRRAALTAACKATRDRWISRGLCGHCGGEELTSKSMGDRCLKDMRDRGLKRRIAAAAAMGRELKRLKCGKCGREGHRRSRCLDVPAPMPALRLEDFMGAPSALAQEMAEGGGTGGHQGRRRAGA
jgi:hypothetical protein